MHLNPPHSGFFCAQPSVTHGMVYHPMSKAITSQKNNRPERFEAIRPAIRISSHVRGSLIQPIGFKSTCSPEVHRLCLPSGYVISLQLPYQGFEVGTAGSLHGHIDRYGGRHFLDGCGGRARLARSEAHLTSASPLPPCVLARRKVALFRQGLNKLAVKSKAWIWHA